MKKIPIETKNNEMPKDKTTCISYTYKGRTSGGFIDAIFLGSLILTGGVWLILFILTGGE